MDSFFSLFDPGSCSDCSNNQEFALDNMNNQTSLPPEPQLGNVEYKLKIVNPTKQRFEHLVTQLKWRLREGNGEAIYEIGVEDSGILAGLSKRDMNASLQSLQQMAVKLGATTTILRERILDNGRSVAEVLVRKIPDDQNNIEIRVAVLGNADAGKSTLLGVLTQGSLDNGSGRARLNMFRHLHEIQSGRTSSISHEILGFNSQGQPINYSYSELITAEEICDSSTKLVTFLDLAGHKKYLRTTIQGLSGYSPHHAMLVISSTAGAVGMAHEHLAIVVALNVPFFIVITKIDLVQPTSTLQSLESFLKQVGSRRVPLIIKSLDDVITAGANQLTENVVPIFCVSSVSGEGLELLLKFLHVLPPGISIKEKERLEQESPEFHIDENFKAGDVGQILGGLLTKGVITEGTKMQIGPMKDGSFQNVMIKSIHRNRVPCRMVRAGQSAAICLNTYVSGLRNGMVLLSSEENAKGCLYFQASVSVLFHATAIYPGFQTTVHIGNIRQTAVVIGICSSTCIHTNERDSVLFKFKVHPEYVSVGQRLLFREGSAKGIGEITQIFPL
ncbi:GTP-binding protein 2 [Diorhabda carinulata]|uniref:GTP-binding protein 2 n=1 Tax=Diorhabda sublineata TaxID=1163346 RepID=UPI0024E151CA|nr:GTP-binding protein 2 [Diorhabda sublineata]XP_056646453.1 GTP-binding protein 2 [Diorhabda sublineata]XP_056646455.1 GTP-binding protein 2 [Diorhabda sublineata]XP_057650940.1 GTP-binding protein 2 [Diorhabda carinulata]